MNNIGLDVISEFDFTNKYFKAKNKSTSYLVGALNKIVGGDRNERDILTSLLEESPEKYQRSFTYINMVEFDLLHHIIAKYNNSDVETIKERLFFDGQTQKQLNILMDDAEYINIALVYELHRVLLKLDYKTYLTTNVVETLDEENIEMGASSVKKQRKFAQSEFTIIYLQSVGLI